MSILWKEGHHPLPCYIGAMHNASGWRRRQMRTRMWSAELARRRQVCQAVTTTHPFRRFHPWKSSPLPPPARMLVVSPWHSDHRWDKGHKSSPARLFADTMHAEVGGREIAIRRWRMGWWCSVVGWGWEGSSSIRENPLTRYLFDRWFASAMAMMVAASSAPLDLFWSSSIEAPPRRSVDVFGYAAPPRRRSLPIRCRTPSSCCGDGRLATTRQ